MDDGQGLKIGKWCARDNDDATAGYCRLCKKTIKCSNQGLQQLKQHAKGSGHKSLVSDCLAPNQATFFSPNRSSGGESMSTSTQQDRVAEAELLWMFKTVDSNYSYASADGICKLFARMFPDSKIASDMALASSKLSYLISDGVGPVLTRELVDDVRRSKTCWCLCYDESPTAQTVNQLDLQIRYFSVAKGEVVCRFYKSIMLGRKPAKKVAGLIIKSLKEDNLPMGLFTTLMGDGPNVNKATHREIDNELKALNFHGLVSIDSCVLHHAHNGFKKGLDAYGSEVEELAIEVFYFFKSGGKREDFNQIQNDMNLDELQFLRHVSSRWLTLIPTVERLLSQLDGLRKFISDLSKDKAVSKSPRYGRISRKLEKVDITFQMYFLLNAGEVFTDFLTLLQCEKPMIHVLHNELCDFIRKLARRFVKAEYLGSLTNEELVDMDLANTDNLIKHTDIDVGERARKALALTKLPSDSRRTYTLKVQDFYKTSTKYLLKVLPLKNDFIKRAAVFDLSKELRLATSTEMILGLARELPHIVNVDDLSRVADEWHLLRATEMPKPDKSKDQKVEKRIDHTWRELLNIRTTVNGELKFKVLAGLVKSVLAVGHGNADVERGFSTNKKIVTPERTNLSPESINGNRVIKDKIKFDGVPVHGIQVTRPMLKARKDAYKHYEIRLDEDKSRVLKKKAEQEAEAQRRELEEDMRKQREIKIKELKEREKELLQDIAVANKLLERGNEELKNAILKKDFTALSFSQSMVESGQKKMSEAQKDLEKVRKSLDDQKSKQAMPSESKKAKLK